MTEEVANLETGAMTEADAVSLLMKRREAPETDKPDAEEAETTEAAPEPQDEPEEAEEEPKPRYKVKVQGEEVEVDLDELLNGYSRQSDYQRKTQALAEERKTTEAEKQRQQQITAQLIEAYQKAATGDDKEPDWTKLADEADPWEFNRQRAGWEAKQNARAEAARRAQELQHRRVMEIATHEAQQLRAKVPEWNDPAKFKAEYDDIISVAAAEYGFRDDEVRNALDHRVLLALRDAVELRKLRKSKPDADKRVAAAPKVVKPGSTPPKADRATDIEAHRNKLKRTGKAEDAVALLLARRKA